LSHLRAVNPPETLGPLQPQIRRLYVPEVVDAQVQLWEASDLLCGKRLHASLPLLVESLEVRGHLQLEAEMREPLLSMSSATIVRLLASIRKANGDKGSRLPPLAYSEVRQRVPAGRFKGWADYRDPGCLEIDLVTHCGGLMEGSFCGP